MCKGLGLISNKRDFWQAWFRYRPRLCIVPRQWALLTCVERWQTAAFTVQFLPTCPTFQKAPNILRSLGTASTGHLPIHTRSQSWGLAFDFGDTTWSTLLSAHKSCHQDIRSPQTLSLSTLKVILELTLSFQVEARRLSSLQNSKSRDASCPRLGLTSHSNSSSGFFL